MYFRVAAWGKTTIWCRVFVLLVYLPYTTRVFLARFVKQRNNNHHQVLFRVDGRWKREKEKLYTDVFIAKTRRDGCRFETIYAQAIG